MKTPQQLIASLPRPAARWTRLFGLGFVVGILGGVAASGLEFALHWGSALLVGRFHGVDSPMLFPDFRWSLLLLPAAGGLLSGLVVQFLFREPFGHGTDLLVRAFHRDMGRLPLRGPLVKGAAAAGVISCGGSAGPEGPIAALGAGIGSAIGRLFRLTARERRIMLVAGCGAGIGAIFRCPLGGALFAASVLYQEEEFEADAIVPAFVASVIGYTMFMTFYGHGTYMLEGVSGSKLLRFESYWELLPYAVLGPLCGLVSIVFSIVLRVVETQLRPRAPLPRWLVPALGGLATGLIACALPQVMDGRYAFIENAMRGFDDLPVTKWWWVMMFAAVILAKVLATALTVGSGAAGGVLGPSVFVGGAVGAFLGAVLDVTFPELFELSPHLQAALIPVGMGGVLAASMRTPLAAIVMVSEMTGSYGLIVPLMLVCMSSYVVGRRWGLNHEQVRSVAESPAHAGDAVVHMLESWRVENLMEREWPETVTPNTSLRELVQRIKPGTRPVFAVSENGRLLGLISVPDIRRIMEEPAAAEAVIAMDMMTEKLTYVYNDQDVYQALEAFRRSNHHVLPVVPRHDATRWLGMLTRERIFETVRQNISETQKLMYEEHVGLAEIEQEGKLQQLVMGVSPMERDMIQRLLVPLDAVGKSLREAEFRRNYGAQVIAIEQPDGTIACPPDLDKPLQTGQRLLAIVWHVQDGEDAEA